MRKFSFVKPIYLLLLFTSFSSLFIFGQSKELLWIHPGGRGECLNIIFSSDSKYFIILDNYIKVWETKALSLKMTVKTKQHVYSGFPITFTRDSKSICYKDSNVIRMFNIDTENIVRSFEGHHSEISKFSISRDNKFLVVGDISGWLYLWDFEKGELLKKIKASDEGISTLRISLDNEHILLTGYRTNLIQSRDLESLELSRSFNGIYFQSFINPESGTEIIMVEKPRDHGNAVVAGYNLYELRTGNFVYDYSFPKSPHGVFVGNDGKYIIVDGNNGGILEKLTLPDFKEKFKFEKYNLHKRGSIILPEKSLLVSILEKDGGIGIWDLNDGKFLNSFNQGNWGLDKLAISPDRKYLISYSRNGSYQCWDFESKELLKEITSHKSEITSIKADTLNHFIYSLEEKGELIVWNALNGEKVKNINLNSHKISMMQVSKNNKLLATYSYIEEIDYENNDQEIDSMTIDIWDTKSLQKINSLAVPDWVIDLAFLSDSNQIVYTSYNQKLFIWNYINNTISGDSIKSFRYGNMLISPDGDLVYIEDDPTTGAIYIHSLEKDSVIFKRGAHRGFISTLSFTDDEKYLCTSGQDDNTIKLWDLSDGTLKKTINFDNGTVWYGQISLSGKYFAGAGRYGDVTVWKVETGEKIKTFNVGPYWFSALAWSPDDKLIITGAFDGTVMAWRFKP